MEKWLVIGSELISIEHRYIYYSYTSLSQSSHSYSVTNQFTVVVNLLFALLLLILSELKIRSDPVIFVSHPPSLLTVQSHTYPIPFTVTC